MTGSTAAVLVLFLAAAATACATKDGRYSGYPRASVPGDDSICIGRIISSQPQYGKIMTYVAKECESNRYLNYAAFGQCFAEKLGEKLGWTDAITDYFMDFYNRTVNGSDDLASEQKEAMSTVIRKGVRRILSSKASTLMDTFNSIMMLCIDKKDAFEKSSGRSQSMPLRSVPAVIDEKVASGTMASLTLTPPPSALNSIKRSDFADWSWGHENTAEFNDWPDWDF